MHKLIIEGLDGTGKTLIAKYFKHQYCLEYHKIKKEVKPTGTEEEITQAIINEMSEKLGDWEGILDRGFYSTVGTGLCFDASMNPYKLYIPKNLEGTTNILVTSTPEMILNRCNRQLTAQDRCVLESGLFDYAQDWMINNMPKGYVRIDNNFNDTGALWHTLEDVVKTLGGKK